MFNEHSNETVISQEDGLALLNLSTVTDRDEECDHCHGPVLAAWPSGSKRFCSLRCRENYEPPDPAGFDGGFAENH